MPPPPAAELAAAEGVLEAIADLLEADGEDLDLDGDGGADGPNDLAQAEYAMSLGLPVLEWRALRRAGAAADERIDRAARLWSERARALIAAFQAGQLTGSELIAALRVEFRQQARNAYVAGRRALGALAAMTPALDEDLDDEIADDLGFLDRYAEPAAAGGAGALLLSLVLDPTNYLGSGLPGDPFAGLPAPIGAGHNAEWRAAQAARQAAGAAGSAIDPEDLARRARAEGAMAGRVEAYADRMHGIAQRGEMSALGGLPAESVVVWWTLGFADHCVDCVRLASGSPYYLSMLELAGLHPGSGHTRCGGKCRCRLEYDTPAVVCADQLAAGQDALSGIVLESAGRYDVFVQEASTCTLPMDVQSLWPGDLMEPIQYGEPFAWDQDVASGLVDSGKELSWSAVKKDASLAAALGWLVREGADGIRLYSDALEDALRVRVLAHPATGTRFAYAYQVTGKRIRYEAGVALDGGSTVLDVEFTLRALQDLGARAAATGRDLAVLQQPASPGMRKWLEEIGAPLQKAADAPFPAYVVGEVPQPGPVMASIPSGPLPKAGDLGGTTGASLVEDPATGKRYVDKRGASPGHVREESAADRAYEAMGVPVAPHAMVEVLGVPTKRAEFQADAVSLPAYLKGATEAERAAILDDIQDGLALDALLANWDVVGLEGDNILVRNGTAIRIDNGGSLRYRAQGKPKGDGWSDKVTELARLRDTSKGSWAGRVFGGVTDARVREQVLALEAKREALLAALPAAVRERVGKRLDDMLEQTKAWGPPTAAQADEAKALAAKAAAADYYLTPAQKEAKRLDGAYAEWHASLTAQEAKALQDYKAGSESLNAWLRDGMPQSQADLVKAIGGDLEAQVDGLDSAIAKGRLPGPLLVAPTPKVVYRGRAFEQGTVPAVGDVLTDPAYLSTTVDEFQAAQFAFSGKGVADAEHVVFRIALPEGTPAAWTDDWWGLGVERELLLDRNVPLEVLAVKPGVKVKGMGEVEFTVVDLAPAEAVPVAPKPWAPYVPEPGVEAWKPGELAQVDMPGSPIPLGAPLADPSPAALGAFDEPALPDLALTKAEMDSLRAAAKAARHDVQGVVEGKQAAVWLTDAPATVAAKAAMLQYDKVGDVRFAAALGDTETTGKIRAYLEGGGTTDTEEWFGLLGHEPAEVDALVAWEEAKAGAQSLRAGVMIVEPDGRVWFMAPRNEYGGYQNTWSKGGLDAGETARDAAVREAREELGLSVELTGYLGDFENASGSSITRYYAARRTGGGPALANAKETYRIKLALPEDARPLLTHNGKPDPRDVGVLDAYVAGPAYVPPAGASPALPGPGAEAVAAGAAAPSVKSNPELHEFVDKIRPPRPDPGGAAPVPAAPSTGFGAQAILAEDPPASAMFGYDHGAAMGAAQNAGTTWSGNEFRVNVALPGGSYMDHTAKVWGDELSWVTEGSQLDPNQRMGAIVAGLDRIAAEVEKLGSVHTVKVGLELGEIAPDFGDMLLVAGATLDPDELAYIIDREHLLNLWHAVADDVPVKLPAPLIPTADLPWPSPSSLADSADSVAAGGPYVSPYAADPSSPLYAVDMHLNGGWSATEAAAHLAAVDYQPGLVYALAAYGPVVKPDLIPPAPGVPSTRSVAPTPAAGVAPPPGPPGGGVVAPGVLSSTYGIGHDELDALYGLAGEPSLVVNVPYMIKGSSGYKTTWAPTVGGEAKAGITVTWDVNKGAIRWYGVTGVKAAGDEAAMAGAIAQLRAWRDVLAAGPDLSGVRLTMLQEMPATWRQLLLDAGGTPNATGGVITLSRQQVDDITAKVAADLHGPAGLVDPGLVVGNVAQELGYGPVAQKYGLEMADVEVVDLPWQIKGKPYTRTGVTLDVEDLGALTQATAKVDWSIAGGEARWYGVVGHPEAKLHAGAAVVGRMAAAAKADPSLAGARFSMLHVMPPEWKELLLDSGAVWDKSILKMTREQLVALGDDLAGQAPAGSLLPGLLAPAPKPPPGLGAKYGHDESLASGLQVADAPVDVKGKPFTATAYADTTPISLGPGGPFSKAPTVKVVWNVNAEHELRWYQMSGGGGAGGEAARHAAAVRHVVTWADQAAADPTLVGARFSMLQQIPAGFRQMLVDYGAAGDNVLLMSRDDLFKLADDLRLDLGIAPGGTVPQTPGAPAILAAVPASEVAVAKTAVGTWTSDIGLMQGFAGNGGTVSLVMTAGSTNANMVNLANDGVGAAISLNQVAAVDRGPTILASIARWADEAEGSGQQLGLAVWANDALGLGWIADVAVIDDLGEWAVVPGDVVKAVRDAVKGAAPPASPAAAAIDATVLGIGAPSVASTTSDLAANGVAMVFDPAGGAAVLGKSGSTVTIAAPPALSDAAGNASALGAGVLHAASAAPGSGLVIRKTFSSKAQGWTELLKAMGAKESALQWTLKPQQAAALAEALKALPPPASSLPGYVAPPKPVLGVDLHAASTIKLTKHQYTYGGATEALPIDFAAIAAQDYVSWFPVQAQVDFEVASLTINKNAGTYVLSTYAGGDKVAKGLAGIAVLRSIALADPGLARVTIANADAGRFGWPKWLKKDLGLEPQQVAYYSSKKEWVIEGQALDALKAQLLQPIPAGPLPGLGLAPSPSGAPATAAAPAKTPLVSKPIPLAAPGASPASAVLPPDAQVAASLGYSYPEFIKVADKGATITPDSIRIADGGVQHTGALTVTPSGGTVVWSSFASTGHDDDAIVGAVAMLRALADSAQQQGKKLYVATGNAANHFPPGIADLLDKAGSTKGYGGAVTAYGEGWLLEPAMAKKLVQALNLDTFEVEAIANAVASPTPLVWPAADALTLRSGKAGEKAIFVDSAGSEWVFKPSPTGRAAHADAAAQELADALGLNVAPVRDYTLEVGGVEVQGTLQKMIPKSTSIKAASELTDKQIAEAMQHQVLDWAVGNADAHLDTFVRDANGKLWGTDKSGAFAAMRTPADSLEPFLAGSGLPSLASTFWISARADPSLLARVHPRDFASTLRRLRNVDEDDYRRLMGPVTADWKQYPRFKSEKDMMDALLARKASAASDFDAFLSRQVREAMAVNPAAVPDEWRTWLSSGGHLNLDATAKDLWIEAKAALDGEFGPYSAAAAQRIMDAQYTKAQSLLRSYTGAGLKSQAGKAGIHKSTGSYGVEYLPLLTPALEYEQFRKLQQWIILNIVSGAAGPVNATWDGYLRRYFNPETGNFRFKRQTGRHGGAKATLEGYQRNGTRPMLSFAPPEGSWHGTYVYVEVGWDQIYAAFAAHKLFQGHSSEVEVMVENLRPDQVIHVSTTALRADELINWDGPLLGH